LHPRDRERAKFFKIHPEYKDRFISWLSGKLKLPSFPAFVATREVDGRSSRLSAVYDALDGSFLEFFREFANDTLVCDGLLFRSFPVSVVGAKELLHARQGVFDSIVTQDDYFFFRYMHIPRPPSSDYEF
jgi:hypothetical protein